MSGLYNYTNITDLYRDFLFAGNAKKNTVKNYLSDIKHFFGWLTTYYSKSYRTDGNVSHSNDGFILNPHFDDYIFIFNTYKDYLSLCAEHSTKRRRLYSLKKFIYFCTDKSLIYPEFNKKLDLYFQQLLKSTGQIILVDK